MSEPPEVRLWCHDGLWRIQDYCQLADKDGVLHDVWESRRKDGQVLLFETEEQAAAYMRRGKGSRVSRRGRQI